MEKSLTFRLALARKVVWPVMSRFSRCCHSLAIGLLRVSRIRVSVSLGDNKIKVDGWTPHRVPTCSPECEQRNYKEVKALVWFMCEPPWKEGYEATLQRCSYTLIQAVILERWNGGADANMLETLDRVVAEEGIHLTE